MEPQTGVSETVELTYSELIALADILQTQISGQGLADTMRDHVVERGRDNPEEFNNESVARFLGSTVPRLRGHANSGHISLRRRGLVEEADDEKHTITNKVLKVYARVVNNPHIKAPFKLVHKSPAEEKHRTYKIAPSPCPILEEALVVPANPTDRNHADARINLRHIPDSTALMISLVNTLAPLRSLSKTPITYPDWYHPVSSVINPSWIETFYRQFPHVFELLRDVDIPDGIARRLTDDCVEVNTYYGMIPHYFSSPAQSSGWYGPVFAIPAASKSDNNYIWLIQAGQFTSDTPDLNVKMVNGIEAIKTIGDHAVEALKHAMTTASNNSGK